MHDAEISASIHNGTAIRMCHLPWNLSHGDSRAVALGAIHYGRGASQRAALIIAASALPVQHGANTFSFPSIFLTLHIVMVCLEKHTGRLTLPISLSARLKQLGSEFNYGTIAYLLAWSVPSIAQ